VSAGWLAASREAWLHIAVAFSEERPLPVFNVSASVPDKGTLVVIERGPMARAVAASWVGVEAAKKLNLENCAIVLLIRPEVIIVQEREVEAP